MKNNCCLFERIFKENLIGVFIFGIFFFCFGAIDVLVLCKLATTQLKWLNTDSVISLEILV